MKKKWLSAAFAASLVVAAAGTAGAGTDTTEPSGTEPAGTEPMPAPSRRARDSYRRHRSRRRSPPTSASPRTRSPSACSPTCPVPSPRWSARSSRPRPVYWDAVNRDGGIAGRQVELLIEDNAYDVPTQLEKYEVIRDNAAIISQSTGSPHSAAIAADLVEDNLIAIPLSWYSGWPDPEFGQNLLRELHLVLRRVDERHRVVAQQPRRADRRADLVPRRVRRRRRRRGPEGHRGARAGDRLRRRRPGDAAVGGQPEPGPQRRRSSRSSTPTPTSCGRRSTRRRSDTIMAGAVGQGYEGLWSGNSPTYSFKLLGTELAPLLDQYYIASTYIALWGADVPGMPEVVEEMTAARPELGGIRRLHPRMDRSADHPRHPRTGGDER